MANLLASWKARLQRNRNQITYVLLLLALFGALAGWALLPDLVALRISDGVKQGFVAKPTALLAHLGISGGFSLLFWLRPREIVFLVAALLGILLTYGSLLINLGV